MRTQLCYRNQSSALLGRDVVIFQKNRHRRDPSNVIAWKVIQHCSVHKIHPFTYTDQLKVSIGDSWGNFTFPMTVEYGTLYEVVSPPSGTQIVKIKSYAPGSKGFAIQNNVRRGAFSILVYRDERLVAQEPVVIPGQQANFDFEPTLYIGTASDVSEGLVISQAVINKVNTQLSVFGILSADVVMRDRSKDSRLFQPFSFGLERVRFG